VLSCNDIWFIISCCLWICCVGTVPSQDPIPRSCAEQTLTLLFLDSRSPLFIVLCELCAVAGDPLQTLPIDLSRSTADTVVFHSLQWRSLFRPWRGTCRVLSGNHRQRGDDAYAALLERIRLGRSTSDDIATINATWDKHTDEARLFMPQLRALRASVETYNIEQLAKVSGDEMVYKAVDSIKTTSHTAHRRAVQELERRAPDRLLLKLRVPIIATRRVSPTVPTGTVGVVVEMPSQQELLCSFKGERVSMQRSVWDVYNDSGGKEATREQFPVVLAWAVTIHRAQGSELSSVCIDFTCDDWACEGLVYAALSRVRFLRSLSVRGLTSAHIKVSQQSLVFWLSLVEAYRAE